MRPLTPDSKFLTTPPLDQVGQAITPLRTQNTNTSLVFTLSPAIELFNWTNHLVTLRGSALQDTPNWKLGSNLKCQKSYSMGMMIGKVKTRKV